MTPRLQAHCYYLELPRCSLLNMYNNSFVKPSSALGMLMLGDSLPQIPHLPTHCMGVPDLLTQTASQSCFCSRHPCRVQSCLLPGTRSNGLRLACCAWQVPWLSSHPEKHLCMQVGLPVGLRGKGQPC